MLNYFFGNASEEESSSERSAGESMEETLNSESSDNDTPSIDESKIENPSSESNEDDLPAEEMTQPHNDKDAIERYGIPACYYILSRNIISAENAMQSAITAEEKKEFHDVTVNYFHALLNEGKAQLAKQEENKQLALAEAEHYLSLIEQYRGALLSEGAMKRKREVGDDNGALKRTRIIEPSQDTVVASDDKLEKKRSKKREGKREEIKEEASVKKRRKIG